MGGTYDPVHFGHLRTALEIKQSLGLKEIKLVPCHIPGHREAPDVSAQHRIAMLNTAIADDPGLVVDDRECLRHQTSYTVHTLESFREEYGSEKPLLLIMGMDAFANLPHWHQWQRILELAHLVVAHRPKAHLPTKQPLKDIIANHLAEDKQQLFTAPAGYLWWQAVTALDISSSHIRQLVQAQLSPKYLIQDLVWHYIKQHRLYGYKN